MLMMQCNHYTTAIKKIELYFKITNNYCYIKIIFIQLLYIYSIIVIIQYISLKVCFFNQVQLNNNDSSIQ